MKKFILLVVSVIVTLTLLFGLFGCTKPAPASPTPTQPAPTATKPASSPTPTQATLKLPAVATMGSAGTGSAGNAAAVGLASVITKYTPMKVTVNPYSTSAEFMQRLITGELDMVYTNAWEAAEQYHGIDWFKDLGKQNIRVIRLGQGTWKVGLLVRKDSGINTVADLKGKRFVTAKGMAILTTSNEAMLKGAGLKGFSDVQLVEVASMNDQGLAMKEGRGDVFQARLGTSVIQDVNTVYPLKFLDAKAINAEAEKTMFANLPGLYYAPVKAGSEQWVPNDVNLLGQDMMVFTKDKLSDDIAYATAKALYEHYDDLAPINAELKNGFKPELSVKANFDVPFHPGAIKFYKEKGIWTADMDKAQQAALASQ